MTTDTHTQTHTDDDNDDDDNKNKLTPVSSRTRSRTRKRKHPISIDDSKNNNNNQSLVNMAVLSIIPANSKNKPKRHKTNKLNPLLNSLCAKEIESAFLLVTNLTVERSFMFSIIDEVYRSFPLEVLQQLQYTSEAEHDEVETRVFKIKKNDKRLTKAHTRWRTGLSTLLHHPHYHRRYVYQGTSLNSVFPPIFCLQSFL